VKEPKIFSQYESALDQFVVAADTTTLDAACDLLFIHGNDLTWGQHGHGLFLADVSTDERFEEVLEVVEARSKINFAPLAHLFIRKFQPHLMDMVTDVAPELVGEADEKGREKVIGTAVATHFASEKHRAEIDKMGPEVFGLEQWLLFADGMASSLVRDAVSLRRRQLAATGMSEDSYDSMLYALQRFDLCEHIIRIAYPENGLHFEMSLASQGEFKATGIMEGAKLVEWFRLKPDLAVLKRGQDNALAVFIADYINKRNPGPRRAYACAYYGDQDGPELDVVIPLLGIGFEVKLYQAPFAQTENKLKNLAKELSKQLPAYAGAGCEQIFYVSNLSEDMAASVLKKALDQEPLGVSVESVAEGMGALLPLLNDIGDKLQSAQEELLERSAQRRIAAALEQAAVQKKYEGQK
jgi:hypothetical protein